MISNGWLLLTVLIPFLGGLACLVPTLRIMVIRGSALFVLPALWLSVSKSGHTVLDLSWFIGGGRLALDSVATPILTASALLWGIAAWHGSGYLRKDPLAGRFYLGYFLAMAGNFLLLLAQDAITFYTGFALMTFASILLVLHRGDEYARRASLVYLVLSLIGEALLFPGMMLIAGMAGSTDLIVMQTAVSADGISLGLLLVMAGFAVKAGAVPLHVWLPLAHSAAPAPASAVLSGCMIKAGLLGWLRLLPLGTPGFDALFIPMILIGLLGMTGGALAALMQDHPKVLLAYSSVSKMGMALCVLATGVLPGTEGSVVITAVVTLAVFHTLNKGTLFLGTSVTPTSVSRLDRMLLWVSLLSFAGLPLLPGGTAKLLVKKVLVMPGPMGTWILPVCLFTASLATVLALLRFARLTTNDTEHAPAPVACLHAWRAMVLLLICYSILQWIHPPVALTIQSLVSLLMPLILAWPIVLLWRRHGRPMPPVLPAGDLLLLVERIPWKWRNINTMSSRADESQAWQFPAVAGQWVEDREEQLVSHGWGEATLLLMLVLIIIIMSL